MHTTSETYQQVKLMEASAKLGETCPASRRQMYAGDQVLDQNMHVLEELRALLVVSREKMVDTD